MKIRMRNLVFLFFVFTFSASAVVPVTGHVVIYNNTNEPVSVRVTKSDGVEVPLGGSPVNVTQTEYTVPENDSLTVSHTFNWDNETHEGLPKAFRFHVEQAAYSATLVGNSYVGPPSEELGWQNTSPATFIYTVDGEYTYYTTVTPPNREANNDALKSLWVVTDTTLTADLFREGVDKIAEKVALGGGGGGGVAIDYDQMPQTTKSEAVNQKVLDALGGSVAIPDGVASSISGASEAKALEAAGFFNDITGSPGELTVTSEMPDFTVSFPARFGSAVFDLNPFLEGRFQAIAAWFRTATEWLVLITLGIWTWRQLDEKIAQVAVARQATGNTVAGTGGQVTALISALAITAAVVSLVTALLSWGLGSISFSTFKDVLGQNPFATIAGGSYWMLDQVLPVTTIVVAFTARLAWQFFAVPLYTVTVTIIRFCIA